MKYICTVCGYIYDDEKEDVPFSELPDSWVCPLCGAPKALFEPMAEENQDTSKKDIVEETNTFDYENAENDDLVLLSAGELSALFSNLARGCEKQYQNEAKECFDELASYFEKATPNEEDFSIDHLANLIKKDLDENYKNLTNKANQTGDRGTLRITTWGQKVTIMAKTLIERYKQDGDAFLQNTGLYVCTVCVFLYVGDNPPELCPVCKVPSWKFEKIDGRTKL